MRAQRMHAPRPACRHTAATCGRGNVGDCAGAATTLVSGESTLRHRCCCLLPASATTAPSTWARRAGRIWSSTGRVPVPRIRPATHVSAAIAATTASYSGRNSDRRVRTPLTKVRWRAPRCGVRRCRCRSNSGHGFRDRSAVTPPTVMALQVTVARQPSRPGIVERIHAVLNSWACLAARTRGSTTAGRRCPPRETPCRRSRPARNPAAPERTRLATADGQARDHDDQENRRNQSDAALASREHCASCTT